MSRHGPATRSKTTPVDNGPPAGAGSTQPVPVDTPVPPAPEQPTLADIYRSIKESNANVCGKLDALTSEVSIIKAKLDHVEASAAMNSDKIAKLEQAKIPEIEKKMGHEIEQLRNKLVEIEIYNRRSNLLFYGIPETREENVYALLRDVFIYLGINAEEATNIALVNAHRLPRREDASHQADSDPPRPSPPKAIIAKFVYVRDRNCVIAAYENRSRQPNSTGDPSLQRPQWKRLTVRTDLPSALKARRSQLAKKAYQMRKERGLSTKIILVGTQVILKWKQKNTREWNTFTE